MVYQDKLYTPHCLNSSSETYDGAQWVRAELIVRGSGQIQHLINGELVLEYSGPRLSNPSAHQRNTEHLLSEGYIALQSESHPIDFRVVRIRNLAGNQ